MKPTRAGIILAEIAGGSATGMENGHPETGASNWTAATGTTPGNRRPLRKAVVVSRPTAGSSAFDALLSPVDAVSADVVFVESTAHAYSRIRAELPYVVVLCVEIDDMAAFRLLSMLKADQITAPIPVITYIAAPRPPVPNEQVTDCTQDSSTSTPAAPSMN